jgi:hypothetical protein
MARLMGRLRKLERVVGRQAQNGSQSQGSSNEEMAGRLRAFAERIATRERLGLPLEPEDHERRRKLQDLAERIRQRKQAAEPQRGIREVGSRCTRQSARQAAPEISLIQAENRLDLGRAPR